jgi:hypothetical protein
MYYVWISINREKDGRRKSPYGGSGGGGSAGGRERRARRADATGVVPAVPGVITHHHDLHIACR